MISLPNKSHCCGCAACAQICPRQCITMKADAEGFLYPELDSESCVQCGLCETVCPITVDRSDRTDQTAAFAAHAKDQSLREASSSGGIFSLLAQQILEQGGVVFGAAFDRDYSVHHIMIDQAEDLSKLQGSKYLQSRIGDTYKQAKTALEAGKWVLFSGTPCQTAGLKSYLRKPYERLYLVDIICHGVPSPKVWQYYLSWQKANYGNDIRRISFRDKRSGWKRFSMAIDFCDYRAYSKDLSNDPYLQVFLRDVCLRPSCYNCAFKGTPRMADITLADAWGVQNWMPQMDDDRGTSVVLIHSRQGKQLWNEISSKVLARSCDMDAVMNNNAAYARSALPHPKREQFFNALNCGASMESLEKISRKPWYQKVVSIPKRFVKKLAKCLGYT